MVNEMEKNDFELLKKKYGENFAKLCRTLFPTILENEGLLTRLITGNFAESRFLYEDITKSADITDDFKTYIYGLVDVEKFNSTASIELPEVLLNRAGYKLYKCESEEEIQSFRKYYTRREELCTFTWGGRNNTHIVFFAVKHNVDEIIRENFTNPKRQDEYGTSVLSIQFTKSNNSTISIKNRYNHRVNNPDATFSNDLDNIIPGLTDSFVKTYDINLVNKSTRYSLDGYVLANDGKFYKYNYEIGNIYYCPNNMIIDEVRNVTQYDKNKTLVLDNYILDLENKKFYMFDKQIMDSFIDIKDINKISVQKIEEGKQIIISPNEGEDIIISLDKQNRIIGYENTNLTTIGIDEDFLSYNQVLTRLNLPNLTTVGIRFLLLNEALTEVNLPKLTATGSNFLMYNKVLKKLNLPNLAIAGDDFLFDNEELTSLNLPSLITTGYKFLYKNKKLIELNLPKLTTKGDNFLFNNPRKSFLMSKISNNHVQNDKEMDENNMGNT